MQRLSFCIAWALLTFVGIGETRADVITFGGGAFTWYHPSGSATPNHIWVAGDYWGQTATTTLASADQLSLNLHYNDNALITTLNMEAVVNGTTVGTFSIPPGTTNQAFSFAFAPIAGPNFDIQLRATNTIAYGDGSVSLAADRSSTATLISSPEPASVMVFGIALAGAGYYGWRRRRQAPSANVA